MQVELWDIGRVKPYPGNPRKISEAAIEKVAASIAEYGFRQPIVTDDEGVIVVGHTRWQGAKRLGLAKVPVHVATDLSADQIRAYRLADNRVGEESDWLESALGAELLALDEAGFDLALTGFDETELAELLGGDNAEGPGGGAGSGSLAERFLIPPFSVLNAREGWWQERKRAWISLGIKSELGRGEDLIPNGGGHTSKRRYAEPGGSAMPSASYSKDGARGDGRGRAVKITTPDLRGGKTFRMTTGAYDG